MKLLHLCHDEKFIPFVQRLYEAAFPNANTFRVWGPRPGQSFRFVTPGERVGAVPKSYWFSRALRSDLEACDVLVVHMLTTTFAHAVRAAPERVMVYWSAFGGDYYNLLDGYRQRLCLPASRRLDELSRHRLEQLPFLRRVSQLIKWPGAIAESIENRDWLARTIPRADAFNSDPYSYNLLLQSQQVFRAVRASVPYACVEDIAPQGLEATTGQNVLLGNSATATNNHIEALQVLARCRLEGRKVICPLSYGSQNYARLIVSAGRRMLGQDFMPILDFMPLSEYSKLIASCDTIVMNHTRGQALGNIIAGLCMGAKVFLRPENHLFQHLRSMGVTVSEWPRDFERRQVDGSDGKCSRNVDVLRSEFCFAAGVRKVRKLAEIRIPEAFDPGSRWCARRSIISVCLYWYFRGMESMAKVLRRGPRPGVGSVRRDAIG